MKVNILLFATLKDAVGLNRLEVSLPGELGTLQTVREMLKSQYPTLGERLDSAVASINQEFAFEGESVKEGDEIAFFPPVSGGESTWAEIYRLSPDPIDLNELTATITTPATGAVCLFSGMVRGETVLPGHLPKTIALEYEAYEPMALAKMRQVVAEIRERWPLVQGVAVAQRIGRLTVGEQTVLIACSSGHRDQGCFEAARYGIDRLKEIVPVWKKEIGADGSQWIEGQYHPRATDRRESDPG
jgi:molybdopterin synthase catalytic subunit